MSRLLFDFESQVQAREVVDFLSRMSTYSCVLTAGGKVVGYVQFKNPVRASTFYKRMLEKFNVAIKVRPLKDHNDATEYVELIKRNGGVEYGTLNKIGRPPNTNPISTFKKLALENVNAAVEFGARVFAFPVHSSKHCLDEKVAKIARASLQHRMNTWVVTTAREALLKECRNGFVAGECVRVDILKELKSRSPTRDLVVWFGSDGVLPLEAFSEQILVLSTSPPRLNQHFEQLNVIKGEIVDDTADTADRKSVV